MGGGHHRGCSARCWARRRGLVLAAVLSYVINVSFFGWTISWATPWGLLLALPGAVILAALVAGYAPARQAARLDIADGVKME